MYVNRGLGSELTFEIKSDCDVTFFVPCMDEEKNIVPTIENIHAAVSKFTYTYQILIVDDGSKDQTISKIKAYKQGHPHVRIDLIINTTNRGLGRNYVDAAYLASGEFIMLVNGDNAEPQEAIEAILAQKGKADMVIPHFGSQDSRAMSRVRLSQFFTWLINTITGNHISYYNGPVLHRRINIIRWHSDTYGFAYQAEVLTRLLEEGATYVEVEIKNLDRESGISKAFRMINVLSVSHSVLQILIRRIRGIIFTRRSTKQKPAS